MVIPASGLSLQRSLSLSDLSKHGHRNKDSNSTNTKQTLNKFLSQVDISDYPKYPLMWGGSVARSIWQHSPEKEFDECRYAVTHFLPKNKPTEEATREVLDNLFENIIIFLDGNSMELSPNIDLARLASFFEQYDSPFSLIDMHQACITLSEHPSSVISNAADELLTKKMEIGMSLKELVVHPRVHRQKLLGLMKNLGLLDKTLPLGRSLINKSIHQLFLSAHDFRMQCLIHFSLAD